MNSSHHGFWSGRELGRAALRARSRSGGLQDQVHDVRWLCCYIISYLRLDMFCLLDSYLNSDRIVGSYNCLEEIGRTNVRTNVRGGGLGGGE